MKVLGRENKPNLKVIDIDEKLKRIYRIGETAVYHSFYPSQRNTFSVLNRLKACIDDVRTWMTANSIKLKVL